VRKLRNCIIIKILYLYTQDFTLSFALSFSTDLTHSIAFQFKYLRPRAAKFSADSTEKISCCSSNCFAHAQRTFRWTEINWIYVPFVGARPYSPTIPIPRPSLFPDYPDSPTVPIPRLSRFPDHHDYPSMAKNPDYADFSEKCLKIQPKC